MESSNKDGFFKFNICDKSSDDFFEYKIKSDKCISNLISKLLIDLEIENIETARTRLSLDYKDFDLFNTEIQNSNISDIFNIEKSINIHEIFLDLLSKNDKQELQRKLITEKLEGINSKIELDSKLNLEFIQKNLIDVLGNSVACLNQSLECSNKILLENLKIKEELVTKLKDKISLISNKKENISFVEDEIKTFKTPFLIDKYEDFLKQKANQIIEISEEIESNKY